MNDYTKLLKYIWKLQKEYSAKAKELGDKGTLDGISLDKEVAKRERQEYLTRLRVLDSLMDYVDNVIDKDEEGD